MYQPDYANLKAIKMSMSIFASEMYDESWLKERMEGSRRHVDCDSIIKRIRLTNAMIFDLHPLFLQKKMRADKLWGQSLPNDTVVATYVLQVH